MKQFGSTNGFNSSNLDVKCGVPHYYSEFTSMILPFCLNKSISSHFADDMCIMYTNCNFKTLETDPNTDLKQTSEWLKANRL